jgi:hypothetical protein
LGKNVDGGTWRHSPSSIQFVSIEPPVTAFSTVLASVWFPVSCRRELSPHDLR